MKKSTLMGLLCASLALPAVAQDLPASTSTDLYDQSPWNNEQIVELFSKVYDEGRNFPTLAEFEALGLTFDLEFVRSHTRIKPIYADASKDIVTDINHDRRLWCNIPGGYGSGLGGYPGSNFDQDSFSFWNYTNLFGAWNYGILRVPGSWVDAAHRNGTRIFSGIKFFEGWSNPDEEAVYLAFVSTKNDDGSYKYAPAMVNACAFFGNDGFNYNSEGSTWRNSDWVGFHKAVLKNAKERGFENFGIGQYTQNASLSSEEYADMLYGSAENGKTFDCMLNYSGNKLAYRSVATSIEMAEKVGMPLDDLYQGQLLVNLSSDYWTQMNTEATKKMNICIWGEHDQSRFFQFRVGENPVGMQSNYQLLLEKAFSGANRNPLNRPAINNSWGSFQVANASLAETQLNNSPGFASMFPERTAVGPELPFNTFFSLGNGENYFYKGKVTHGSWYNMSQQDVVPTYRWLVTAKGDMKTYANDIDVRFSHEDAYIGGSSLKLTGATTAGNDIVLYRSSLKVGAGSPVATLAVKSGKTGTNASNLSLILKKQGSDNWIEVPYGDLDGATWQAKELPIAGLAADDVIEYIGLRVNSMETGSNLYVGQLKLSDGRTIKHAPIEKGSLKVEVKEETAKSLSLKLNWMPNYTGFTTSYAEYGNVYNDEINVDHFEVVYKESADAPVKELARTAQWAAYIGNIPMSQSAVAYIGVRSVSTDLKCISPVEWVEIPRYTGELPEVKEEDPYGKSWMSSIGVNSTLEQIISQIYAEKVETTGATQDLKYFASSAPLKGVSEEQYYFAEDHKLILTQGQEISMLFKGYQPGGNASLQYDFIYAYIDYDGNYSFLDADETLGSFGTLNAGTTAIVNPGITINFKVPEDAHIGPSRLRIVGSDAWTAHPGPVGGTVKGYTIDFPVEIQGTNPDRGPAETYKDRRDQGEPEQPEYIENGFSNIAEIATNGVSAVNVADGVAYFTNVDKAWFFDVAGRMVKFVNDGAESVAISELPAGVYVVKMEYNNVIRSQKVVKK